MCEMKYGASLHCSVNRELEDPSLLAGPSPMLIPLIHFLVSLLVWGRPEKTTEGSGQIGRRYSVNRNQTR